MANAKVKVQGSREIRINEISEKLAAHHLKMRQQVRHKRFKLSQRIRKRPGKLADIVAYDLETTRIKAGTPEPLYITAYSDHRNYILSTKIDSIQHLAEILKQQFLIPTMSGVRFVAWNANNFDVYFVALALMKCDEFILRPYLTKSKALRGVRVIRKADLGLKPNQQKSWEFVDGIAMLGLQGKTLKEFLKTFAPDYQKQERESFETKEFDPTDPVEIAYAFRDSEGLYWGMQYAQQIIFERFNMGLQTTMGNLGIKIFQTRIPEDTKIIEPTIQVLDILRSYVCRGGYCHLMRRFQGKVWKYDLNQAYAAAMRETELPAGDAKYIRGESKYSKCYIARVTANNPNNTIPFYCRVDNGQRITSSFLTTKIDSSWITSQEIEQLRAENWNIKIHECYVWYSTFNMKDYVDSLEQLRSSAPGGSSGAVGTMIKQIGNNSYGKTLEQLEPLELVLAPSCPPGFVDYYGDDSTEHIPFVWCRFQETPAKAYHQPQIGAFITAHVRMVVRRAALIAPDHFLYADTDCVIFSKDVTKKLDINATRYGAFKVEDSGVEYMLIAKKVYASIDFKTKHSKGLNVKNLTFGDFVSWYAGKIPQQNQAQRQNFVKFLRGSPMFVNRTRKGTAI